MNRLLVLGDTRNEPQWLHRLLGNLRPRPRYASSADGSLGYDSLLVLDDGGSAGAEALRSALAVREDRPGIAMAVVRCIDRSWSSEEALTRSLLDANNRDSSRISEQRMKAIFHSRPEELDVQISPNAIQFEYSGE